MNVITNSAAMFVLESGSTISQKKRIAPAPSMRAASINSSGSVMKNWRNRNVAVADAISGSVKPLYVLLRCIDETTCTVGKMRTSTGSISVTKISQNAKPRNGKRKNTIAYADIIDTAILPIEITSAMTRLLNSMRPNGAAALPLPCDQTDEMFSNRCVPGTSDSGTAKTCCSLIVAAQNATYTGNTTSTTPTISTAWQKRSKPRRFSIMRIEPGVR